MTSPIEITIGRLRLNSNVDGTRFSELYRKLMSETPLELEETIDLQRAAVLFLRSGDAVVNRLGYRILLQYSSVSGDYEGLLEVARAKEYMPVVAAIERFGSGDEPEDGRLAPTLFQAHMQNFAASGSGDGLSYRTRGQMELRAFAATHDNGVLVAPTSYGKSEMLVEKVRDHRDQAVCVLVPTRALIAQTRKLLIDDETIRTSRVRVLTHPDAYTGETEFIAVMTQERLQRLFKSNSELKLDLLLVDEAHNLLPAEQRAQELSQVIITARHRNPELGINYFTPFLASIGSLTHVTEDRAPMGKTIREYVKVEKVFHANIETGELRLYDQFLNKYIPQNPRVPTNELKAILKFGGLKNLVYVNRPRDAQLLAARLASKRASVASDRADIAIQAISDLIDPSYSLIECIRKGVLFHHGKVPDLLRGYIEDLFRQEVGGGSILVTTSTLLEGVNTPADRLFIMTPSKGRGYLSSSAFKNLIGRVGRFKEAFATDRHDLNLLQPRIYLMKGSYAPSNWAVEDYIARVADARKAIEDDVENPLLQDSPRLDEREVALEYLENIEPGSTRIEAPRIAQTEVGAACFKNGVRDFDIFESELAIQANVERYRESARTVSETSEVVDAICEIFLDDVQLSEESDLGRVRENDGARRFYSQFLGWRANNEPYKRMIAHFLRYWSRIQEELVYVGNTWGEVTYGDGGFRQLYVRMPEKSKSERINLAVAKVKEEQDFVDFHLVRYIEIMNELELVTEDLYNRVKFGTSDPYLICLLRNGMSPELARLVQSDYRRHVDVNLEMNEAIVLNSLPATMSANDENDILIYEALTLAVSDTPDVPAPTAAPSN